MQFCNPPGKLDLPGDLSFKAQVRYAKEFRKHQRHLCDMKACDVCGMFKPPQQVDAYKYRKIPNLDLLVAGSDALSRASINGVEYVLACPPENGRVSMCDTCYANLDRGKVPPESLASFDAGCIPSHLKPLTTVEENLVARYQVCR